MADGPKILIVDDEPNIRDLLTTSLRFAGFAVRAVATGAQTISAVLEEEPDLILLDVIMPGADGGEIASRIRADNALKHVPVVFLTATVSRHEAADGKFTGGYLFLPKPVSLKALVECMENVLAAKKHEQTQAEVKKPAA